jgi:hypothetical protein
MAKGMRQDRARQDRARQDRARQELPDEGRVTRAVLLAVGLLAVVTLLALVLGGPLAEPAPDEVRGSAVGPLATVA